MIKHRFAWVAPLALIAAVASPVAAGTFVNAAEQRCVRLNGGIPATFNFSVCTTAAAYAADDIRLKEEACLSLRDDTDRWYGCTDVPPGALAGDAINIAIFDITVPIVRFSDGMTGSARIAGRLEGDSDPVHGHQVRIVHNGIPPFSIEDASINTLTTREAVSVAVDLHIDAAGFAGGRVPDGTRGTISTWTNNGVAYWPF